MEQFYIFHNCILIDDIELLGLMPRETTHIVGAENSTYWGDTVYFVCCLN